MSEQRSFFKRVNAFGTDLKRGKEIQVPLCYCGLCDYEDSDLSVVVRFLPDGTVAVSRQVSNRCPRTLIGFVCPNFEPVTWDYGTVDFRLIGEPHALELEVSFVANPGVQLREACPAGTKVRSNS